MNIKKFFKKLHDLNENGLVVGTDWYFIKFYAQARSFSYEIHKGYKDSDGDLRETNKDPIFRSEIYYYWMDARWKRKSIIKDIDIQLKFIKITTDDKHN